MAVRESLLDHERLDVYQLARQLSRTIAGLLTSVPPGRADLVDQARRACLSIPLNIAEGGGEFAPREKARFYRMARSATELAAVLDHLVDTRLLPPVMVREAKSLLHRIVSALTKLILSLDQPRLPTPRAPRAPSPARAREPERAPSPDPRP